MRDLQRPDILQTSGLVWDADVASEEFTVQQVYRVGHAMVLIQMDLQQMPFRVRCLAWTKRKRCKSKLLFWKVN